MIALSLCAEMDSYLAMGLGATELPALAETIEWLCRPNPNEDSARPELADFRNAMTARVESLSDGQITGRGNVLIAAMGSTGNYSVQILAGNALVAFAPRLRTDQITRGGDALIAALGKANGSEVLQAAGNALVLKQAYSFWLKSQISRRSGLRAALRAVESFRYNLQT